jgi:hypothetical protein
MHVSCTNNLTVWDVRAGAEMRCMSVVCVGVGLQLEQPRSPGYQSMEFVEQVQQASCITLTKVT